jgi:aspartokinase
MKNQSIFSASGLGEGRKAAALRSLREMRLRAEDIESEAGHLVLVMEDAEAPRAKAALEAMGLGGGWRAGLSKVSMIVEGQASVGELYPAFLAAIEDRGIGLETAQMGECVLSAWVRGDPGEAVKAVHGLLA